MRTVPAPRGRESSATVSDADVRGSISCSSFGEEVLPSGKTTIRRLLRPTAAGACETFFSVTEMSNGTPGRIVPNGRVAVTWIGCAFVSDAPAQTGQEMIKDATKKFFILPLVPALPISSPLPILCLLKRIYFGSGLFAILFAYWDRSYCTRVFRAAASATSCGFEVFARTSVAYDSASL